MSLIQVRGVDDAVRDELKSRAASRGLSLNAYLLELLSEAVRRPTREEVLDRVERRLARSDVSTTEVVRRSTTIECRSASAGLVQASDTCALPAVAVADVTLPGDKLSIVIVAPAVSVPAWPSVLVNALTSAVTA